MVTLIGAPGQAAHQDGQPDLHRGSCPGSPRAFLRPERARHPEGDGTISGRGRLVAMDNCWKTWRANHGSRSTGCAPRSISGSAAHGATLPSQRWSTSSTPMQRLGGNRWVQRRELTRSSQNGTFPASLCSREQEAALSRVARSTTVAVSRHAGKPSRPRKHIACPAPGCRSSASDLDFLYCARRNRG